MRKFKCNDQAGFTLIEVTSALLLLSIVTAGIIPLLTTIYVERADVAVERNAYLLLEKEGYEMRSNGRKNITVNEVQFQLTKTGRDVCVVWAGPAGRDKEQCLEFPQ